MSTKVAVVIGCLSLMITGAMAAAPCVDQVALTGAYDAVRAGCSCSGLSRQDYGRCGKSLIDARIAATTLPRSCRRGALSFVKQSTCGRPGMIVCCRITATPRQSHRIVPVGRCVAPSGGTACVSTATNVIDGCDATGCSPPPPPASSLLECPVSISSIAVASNGTNVAAAWSSQGKIYARRLDPTGVALDAASQIVSPDIPSSATHMWPAVDSDGTDYGIAWSSQGPTATPGTFYAQSIRELASDGTLSSGITQVAYAEVPPGPENFACNGPYPGGPIALAATGPHQHAALSDQLRNCLFGPDLLTFHDPIGALVTLPAGTTTPMTGVGFPYPPAPNVAVSAPVVASRGPESLVLWQATDQSISPVPDPNARYFLQAAWVDATGAGTQFELPIPARFKAVVAGTANYLVAWSDADGVRGRRIPPYGAPLDPESGLELAVTSHRVWVGPVVAFDGTNWMLVWLEQHPDFTYSMHAIGVRQDGTAIDTAPRLLANDVIGITPAVSSPAPGQVMIVFAQTSSECAQGVRTLVTPIEP